MFNSIPTQTKFNTDQISHYITMTIHVHNYYMNLLLWYCCCVGRLLSIIEDVVYYLGNGAARRGCRHILFVWVGGVSVLVTSSSLSITIFITMMVVIFTTLCVCINRVTNHLQNRHTRVQWNTSIAATLGEQHFSRYNRGGLYWGIVLYTNCSFGTWVPSRYTEVAVKRGSTVACMYGQIGKYSNTKLLWHHKLSDPNHWIHGEL